MLNDKVLYGVYLVDKDEGSLLSNSPEIAGYVSQEFVEGIIEDEVLYLTPTSNKGCEGVKRCGITQVIRQVVQNIPCIVLLVTDKTWEEYPIRKPLINKDMADMLLDYIDTLAQEIIQNHTQWKDLISKISSTRSMETIRSDNKLSVICDKLEQNEEYIKVAKLYSDPLVPYKKFLELFFEECNYYDIIPMQRERLSLFSKQHGIR